MDIPKISPREQEKINKINAEAKDKFGKDLFTKERPFEDDKHRIQERLERRGVDGSLRRLSSENEAKVKGLLKSDYYNKEKLVVNEKIAREYERFIEAKINKLKR